MSGEDFSPLLAEFEQPSPEVDVHAHTVETKSMPQKKSKLDEFLEFNNVTKDSPEYDSFVEDFYKEFPNEKPCEGMVENPVEQIEDDKNGFDSIIRDLIKDEMDAIDEYSKAVTKIMSLEDLDEVEKRRVIARLKEIRGDEETHYAQLNELLKMKGDEEVKYDKQ
ncbi:MAG: hypothetical protein K5765_06850 [Clostridia bacterium]|nr:hypothetical protein [Clostridia bacterium]